MGLAHTTTSTSAILRSMLEKQEREVDRRRHHDLLALSACPHLPSMRAAGFALVLHMAESSAIKQSQPWEMLHVASSSRVAVEALEGSMEKPAWVGSLQASTPSTIKMVCWD